MRKFLFLFAISLGLTSYAVADLKIAVVDVNAVFENSVEASALMKEIKERQQQVREKFVSEKAAIEAKYKELGAQKDMLSEEAFNEKVNAISEEAALIEKNAAKTASSIENEYVSRVESIGQKVKLLIDQCAAKNKFDLVFNSSQILYSSEAVEDKTGTLVERLNAEGSTNTTKAELSDSKAKSKSEKTSSSKGKSSKKQSRSKNN